jgi:hypothetical protein
MTNIPILDLIAGMIFIYFLMSIISNAIFEGYSSIRKIRATMLEKWIKSTIPNLATSILDHSLVNGMSNPGKSNSYLTGKNFSLSLLEIISQKVQTIPQNLAQLSTILTNLNTTNPNLIPNDLAGSLQLFVIEAQQASAKAGQLKTEFELYHDQVEKWFDSMMERLTGSYKRNASRITFIIAFLASFVLNIDSINIAEYLYANKDSREKLAVAAYAAPDDEGYTAKVNQIQMNKTIDTITNMKDSLQTIVRTIQHQVNSIDSTNKYLGTFIPVGWNQTAEFNIFKSQHKTISNICWMSVLFWISKFFGLMITVFAISLGAPFWFDILNKIANLRNSLKPESVTTKSKGK